MPKRNNTDGPIEIARDTYNHMVDTMISLTWRGPKEEDIIMRCAKAGDISEVTGHITKMRKYAKKHADSRRLPPAQTKGSPRRRRTKSTGSNDGESTGATS